MRKLEWETIKNLAVVALNKRGLGSEYSDRLNFEFDEIEKQGANQYWADLFNEKYKYDTNENGLVLPYVLNMTKIDPLETDHKITRSTDLPDIDVDCLPVARDKIKAYAAKKYGTDYVCSVGTWLTYKFRSAIQDAARGLGKDVREAMILTKSLPDDVDDLKDGGFAECSECGHIHKDVVCPKCESPDVEGITIGHLLNEYDQLALFNDQYPEVIDAAVRMVGNIKAMGKHAGGVIITNRKLMGNVPMGISKTSDGEAQWTSMWTEGRNTQLSKFGYVKWDLLGLKTLQYIHEACKLAEETRNVKFNAIPWKDNDPEANCVGYYWDKDGNKLKVAMDDDKVFKMINDLRVETVFQFETDIQRGVLANGVKDYYDLQVFNAMGHPGPIACIGPQSNINTDNGYKKPFELGNDDRIAYLDKNGNKSYTNNYKLIYNGKKRLIKIETKSGKTLYVTSDHKVKTDMGYVEAGDLNVGSKIFKFHKQSGKSSR